MEKVLKRLKGKKLLLSAVLAFVVNLQADWKSDTGDVLQIALPLAGLGGTYIADDKEGRWMLVKGFGLNMAVTHTTKQLVEKWRPRGQNADTFPSGHTAAAFGGAAFIQTRYGYTYGIPAYALAAFTGYSRITSENHYADDVVAGASIAMMSNWAFTEPFVDDVTLSASAVDGGMKISANIPIGGDDRKSEPVTEIKNVNFKSDVRFVFEFGAAWMNKNEIKAPGASGDTVDFNTYAGTADPTSSVRSGFEFYLDDSNEIFLQFSPYEMRVTGALPKDTNFNGKTYTKSTSEDDTFMAYRWNEYRARWRYKLVDDRDFILKLGAGISVSENQVELSDIASVSSNQGREVVSSVTALPIGHVHAGMKIGSQSELYAELDAGGAGNTYMLDTTLQYRYKMSKHWDIGGGYRYQSVRVDTSELYNQFSSDNLVMNLGYAFAY